MQSSSNPSLFGINRENSDRHGKDLWGKNQFNSTFPLALCLLMRKRDIAPVAVLERGGGIHTDDKKWHMGDVIGSSTEDTRYRFESAFKPYDEYCRDTLDKIDLVVTVANEPVRPLEIKLTVVPDISTAHDPDQETWAPEMVMRPVSSAYAMMSVATSLNKEPKALEEVLARLRVGYNRINNWDNQTEVAKHFETLKEALNGALSVVATEKLQKPFLVQPLWRTVGQSFELEKDHCFDVFVWSDAAIMRVPADQSNDASNTVSRPQREVARHVRGLYDLLSQGDYSYSTIYKGMPFGQQTDKSFSFSGRSSIRYLKHERLSKPLFPSSVLDDLIIGDGGSELKPERRFDAAVLAYMISHRQASS